MGPLAWTPADLFLALRTCCAYPRSEYSLVLVWTHGPSHSHHSRSAGVFSQLLARVSCAYGFSREIEPEALARLVGWSMTLEALALRLRCSNCGEASRGREQNYVPFRRNIVRTLDEVRIDR
jgi:hypothetical protein